MSFRWFIYYCALCGGCAAYLGWALGRMTSFENALAVAGVKGFWLGLMVALTLSIIDGLWNGFLHRWLRFLLPIVLAALVGSIGGFLGGVLGQLFYGWLNLSFFLILGWTLTGTLIGIAPAAFELLASALGHTDSSGARRKARNGLLGGSLGGLLGGVLFLALQHLWDRIFKGRTETLWSPSATGFATMGICLGLLIALAQVILRQAWLKVEVGFRQGRELMLSGAVTTIGRAETCDLGLFGDPTVERLHARIEKHGTGYLLCDADTPSGTFLNGKRVLQPNPLRAGDLIQVGKCQLRFGEREHHRST